LGPAKYQCDNGTAQKSLTGIGVKVQSPELGSSSWPAGLARQRIEVV
jgi:hypothetical protein